MTLLAIIGGSTLEQLPELQVEESFTATSEFGEPSANIVRGLIGQNQVLFLSRHGKGHEIAPHRVNYQANIDALSQAGAKGIIAVNTVGAIRQELESGSVVIPDQLIDYTWGREGSFFDGKHQPLKHIDFTHPFSQDLRQQIIDNSDVLNVRCHIGGTYACTQGPRLETAAEIQRFKSDGCDVVGMTLCPEAALAAELGIPYASICLVVNPAAGVTDEVLSEEVIMATARASIGEVEKLLVSLITAHQE